MQLEGDLSDNVDLVVDQRVQFDVQHVSPATPPVLLEPQSILDVQVLPKNGFCQDKFRLPISKAFPCSLRDAQLLSGPGMPAPPPVSMRPISRLSPPLSLSGAVRVCRRFKPYPNCPSPAPKPTFGPTSAVRPNHHGQPLLRPQFASHAWHPRMTLQQMTGKSGGSTHLGPSKSGAEENRCSVHGVRKASAAGLPGSMSKARCAGSREPGAASARSSFSCMLKDGRAVSDLGSRVSKMPRALSTACPTKQSIIHENNWKKIMLVWAEVTSALRHASPVLSAAQGSPHRSTLEEALPSRVSDTTALR